MVTSMLEKAIEIEGLLRIIRDGNPLPETYKLLKDKTDSLASEATALAAEAMPQSSEEEQPSVESPDADFVMEAPEVASETPTVDFISLDAPKEQTLILKDTGIAEPVAAVVDNTEIDLDLEEEMEEDDDIILSFEDIPEQAQETEENITSYTVSDRTAENDTDAGEKSSEEEETHDVDMQSEESSEKEEENSVPAQAPQQTQVDKPAAKRQVKLRSVFSLNDRFLYARELFNGNMKMFDATIEYLDGIDDFSVIEDYFYNELEWNPEDGNVATFMDKLRSGMKVKG